MNRGLFVLIFQFAVCFGVTGLGLWALLSPRRLQHVVNENYGLLPAVTGDWQLTPWLLRLLGPFLIWYGYTLVAGYRDELLFLGRVFGLTSP